MTIQKKHMEAHGAAHGSTGPDGEDNAAKKSHKLVSRKRGSMSRAIPETDYCDGQISFVYSDRIMANI